MALVGLLAACLVAARDLHPQPTSFFAEGAGGIVVADFSSSIHPSAYARMSRVLRSFADSGQRLGLVVFSDSAYEMLPPGTRGEEVRPILRYLTARRAATQEAPETRPPSYLDSPWSGSFRGGTRISSGLRLARTIIQRDRVARPTVLLLSDLDDPASDKPLVAQEVARYRRLGIRLRVVPLFASEQNTAAFIGLVGPEPVLDAGEVVRRARADERQDVAGAFPLALVAASAALLLLLAVSEDACRRLSWRWSA